MRYVTGFSAFILSASEEDLLKQKFRNCLKHCYLVYLEMTSKPIQTDLKHEDLAIIEED